MGWFSKASKACEKRGYEVLGFEDGGWNILLKRKNKITPITDHEINHWIKEDEKENSC